MYQDIVIRCQLLLITKYRQCFEVEHRDMNIIVRREKYRITNM